MIWIWIWLAEAVTAQSTSVAANVSQDDEEAVDQTLTGKGHVTCQYTIANYLPSVNVSVDILTLFSPSPHFDDAETPNS